HRRARWAHRLGLSGRELKAFILAEMRPYRTGLRPGPVVSLDDRMIPAGALTMLNEHLSRPGPDVLDAVARVWAEALLRGQLRAGDLFTMPAGFSLKDTADFGQAVGTLRAAELDESKVAHALAVAGLADAEPVPGAGPRVTAKIPNGAGDNDLIQMARLVSADNPWPVLGLLLRHYLLGDRSAVRELRERLGDSLARLSDEDLGLWGLLVAHQAPLAASDICAE